MHGVIGLYFFENEVEKIVNVNTDLYVEMLENFVKSGLNFAKKFIFSKMEPHPHTCNTCVKKKCSRTKLSRKN